MNLIKVFLKKDCYISDEAARKYLDDEVDTFKRIEKLVKKESYGKLKGLGFLVSFSMVNLKD